MNPYYDDYAYLHQFPRFERRLNELEATVRRQGQHIRELERRVRRLERQVNRPRPYAEEN